MHSARGALTVNGTAVTVSVNGQPTFEYVFPKQIVDGVPVPGFNTPSRLLEFYSPTMAEWGWPEHTIPRYVPGHVHWRDLKREEGEFDLLIVEDISRG